MSLEGKLNNCFCWSSISSLLPFSSDMWGCLEFSGNSTFRMMTVTKVGGLDLEVEHLKIGYCNCQFLWKTAAQDSPLGSTCVMSEPGLSPFPYLWTPQFLVYNLVSKLYLSCPCPLDFPIRNLSLEVRGLSSVLLSRKTLLYWADQDQVLRAVGQPGWWLGGGQETGDGGARGPC